MPMHISPSIDTDLSHTETTFPWMGPITNPDILGILQREQDCAMALLSSSPLLAGLFVSYAALEPTSATPSPESEEWKALQNTITTLQEEIKKLKPRNLEIAQGLGTAKAAQEAFRSQVTSLKEANAAQQGDIKSLRAELIEAKGKYDRLLVESSAEKTALQSQASDLETQRGELKDILVDQQIKISKFERQGFSGLPRSTDTTIARKFDAFGDRDLTGALTRSVATRSARVPTRKALPNTSSGLTKPRKQVKTETLATLKPQPAPSPRAARQSTATPSTPVSTASNCDEVNSPRVPEDTPGGKKEPITTPAIVDKVDDSKESPLDLTRSHALAPGPSDPPTQTPLIYHFGCVWDPVDYSCSYDCVFMSLAWIYFHAGKRWRKAMARQLPAAKTLSDSFKTIFNGHDGNRVDQETATLFSRSRDAFRDFLSEEDPSMFSRHGPVYGCLADIFSSLSRDQTSSQYFSLISSCGGPNCDPEISTPAGASLMLSPNIWMGITRSKDQPYRESLQEWITAFFDHEASSMPRSCPQCHTGYSQTRTFLRPPWIWFEVFTGQTHVVLPPFELSLSSDTYRLAAVIYGDGRHFVARLSTPSGAWWFYDGQVNGGRPVMDFVVCEEDLLTCGDGYMMNVLVYCPTR